MALENPLEGKNKNKRKQTNKHSSSSPGNSSRGSSRSQPIAPRCSTTGGDLANLKGDFFFSNPKVLLFPPKRCQCSQRSHLMRERNSNCCQPLQSSPLMITPLAFAASSQPLWEFLSQETLQLTSPLPAGREVEHDRLRKDAPVYRDDRACASVSLRHQAQIPQLVGLFLRHEHVDQALRPCEEARSNVRLFA